MSKKIVPQKERLGKSLLEISVDVTAKDRAAYMKDEDSACTKQTLSRYLNGDVADADRGINMLTFFKQRIKNRDSIIA